MLARGLTVLFLGSLAALVVVSSHAWREHTEDGQSAHRLVLRRTADAGPWDLELAQQVGHGLAFGARARRRGEDRIVVSSSRPYSPDDLAIFDAGTYLRADRTSAPLVAADDIVRVTDSYEGSLPTCTLRLRTPLDERLPSTLELVRPHEGTLAIDTHAIDGRTFEVRSPYGHSLESGYLMLTVCAALRGAALAARWEVDTNG